MDDPYPANILNIATTLADNFTITPTTSKVVVKNAGAQFNVVKQVTEGNADITFETAAVPAGQWRGSPAALHHRQLHPSEPLRRG